MSAVAKLLGVSRTAIYDAQNGKVPVSDKMWRLLNEAEVSAGILGKGPQAPYGEKAAEHLIFVPLRAAAAAANNKPGNQNDRQNAFETYLHQIHQLRAEAEKLAHGNTSRAIVLFDKMLATWLASQENLSP